MICVTVQTSKLFHKMVLYSLLTVSKDKELLIQKINKYTKHQESIYRNLNKLLTLAMEWIMCGCLVGCIITRRRRDSEGTFLRIYLTSSTTEGRHLNMTACEKQTFPRRAVRSANFSFYAMLSCRLIRDGTFRGKFFNSLMIRSYF